MLDRDNKFWSNIHEMHHNWWRDMGPRVWHANRSTVMRMEELIVFFEIRCLVNYEFVPEGQMVDEE